MKESEIVEVVENAEELVASYNLVFDEIKNSVIGRSEELDAIKVCVLCKQHVLLEGPAGVAKSLLASSFARSVKGAVFFKKLLMKSTQADELFGPMSAKKYREEEIWHHNTKGMLPSAHLVFIDEVYRGSDSILPTMLNVLNEREFINGRVVEKCPLISAIGACNSIPENEDLNAFHDRWLLYLKVAPLTTSQQRIAALTAYLAMTDEEPAETITLDDIQAICRLVPQITVDDDVKELYEELVRVYRSNSGGVYISDRRFCHGIRVAQARAVLDGKSKVLPEYLVDTKLVLSRPGRDTESQFTTAYESVIGNYEASQQENKKFNTLEKHLLEMQAKYDESMSPKRMAGLYRTAKEIVTVLSNMPADEMPKSERGRRQLEECLRGYNVIANSCAEKLNIDAEVAAATEMPEAVDVEDEVDKVAE